MAQHSKTASKQTLTRAVQRVSPKRKVPFQPPFLRFYHSETLRTKTLAVLDELEHSQDSSQHRAALAGIVVELTHCGMDAYFMKPLKLSKAGFIVEQSASFGMSSAVQVMSSVIRNIIGRMGPTQLLSVCASIRQFIK